MMHLLFIFAAVTALVAGCPGFSNPPSPSAVNATNEKNTLNRRWVEGVTDPGSFAKPWPRGQDGFTRIQYCYATEEDRFQAIRIVEDAKQLWTNALGQAGPVGGHSLLLQEHWPNLCYRLVDTGTTRSWEWDPQVSEDTVVIYSDSRSGNSGVVGYLSLETTNQMGARPAGRHQVTIGRETRLASFGKSLIAHELGKQSIVTWI